MTRVLDDWLLEYLDYSKHSEAPDKFHFWTGVSVIAGALRRHVWLDMGHFTWTPNFFIFFVAPPGIVNKTSTGSIGMKILKELDYINFGPSAGTYQALIKKMSECGEEFFLPNGDMVPMTAITLVLTELGTFLDFKNSEQIDILSDLWDGMTGVWKKSTKYDGDENIINPWINILGFTTPAWLAENMTDYFSGGGFMSRSVFIYAEKKRRLVAYPSREMPQDMAEKHQKLLHDLEQIASMVGCFVMEEEAYEWGTAWYEDHYNKDHKHLSNEKFLGYLARKQTHLHKLAMILSVSESNELVIKKHHLEKADKEITKIEKDMPRIFGKMNREKEVLMAADVLTFLKTKKSITRSALYREFMNTMQFDTFEKILRSLLNSGYITTPVYNNVLHIKLTIEV